MIDYEIAIGIINNCISSSLPITRFWASKERFKEQCYIRWALTELVQRLQEEYFDIPPHISGKKKPDVLEIIDSFIYKMDELLSIEYNWMFDVGMNTAIQMKCYLRNTNLF